MRRARVIQHPARPVDSVPPDALPAPADDEELRRLDSLLDALRNPRSTPEQLHCIGDTLIACEAFLDDHGIKNQQTKDLIGAISEN